jgi:ATP-dependent helicase Lhr and Lhr-like helicase
MISFKKIPDKDESIFKVMNPFVREWFKGKFIEFSQPQRFGVLEIHNQKNTLITT